MKITIEAPATVLNVIKSKLEAVGFFEAKKFPGLHANQPVVPPSSLQQGAAQRRTDSANIKGTFLLSDNAIEVEWSSQGGLAIVGQALAELTSVESLT